jgi:transketolase
MRMQAGAAMLGNASQIGRCECMAAMLRRMAADCVPAGAVREHALAPDMAIAAVALWHGHLRHNPANPHWPDRDRFVCAQPAGGAYATALRRLSGYEVAERDARPDACALAQAVAIATESSSLASHFNRPGHAVLAHHTYAFLGEGCLASEACRAACAHAVRLRLERLIVLYVANPVAAGNVVCGRFDDATSAAFRAHGWALPAPVDGGDVVAIGQAIALAKTVATTPTMIMIRPARGVAEAGHDAAGDAAQIARWWDGRVLGGARECAWRRRFAAYRESHPDAAREFAAWSDGHAFARRSASSGCARPAAPTLSAV